MNRHGVIMKTRFIFILPFLILFLAINVRAEPYVGLGVGSAAYDVDLSTLGGGKFDDAVTATKFYGGYAFNRYFAVEAAVYNFADASVGAIDIDPDPNNEVFVSAEANMKGVAAYAVAMYPLSKEVNLMAKLGVLNWDADLRLNTTTANNDGSDVAYALAASYAVSKALRVVAEWENFDSDNPELSMLSLGFRFSFK